MRLTKTLQQILGSLRRRTGIKEGKTETVAAFELRYDGLHVGTLTCKDGHWTFWYSEDFRHRPDLRPLVQFADVDRVYRSERLWPFFLLRIPSISQSDVQQVLKLEHIDASNEVALLRRFGKRTIANPFELTEVDAGDVQPPEAPSTPVRAIEPVGS